MCVCVCVLVHSSYQVVRAPSGPRNRMQTVKTSCFNDVADLLSNGLIPPGECGNIKDNIHTRAVSNYMQSQAPNPIMDRPPPPGHPSEEKICQPFRSVLAQFCPSYSVYLRSFAHRIDLAPDGVYPCCGYVDENVAHVFDFPAATTTLAD